MRQLGGRVHDHVDEDVGAARCRIWRRAPPQTRREMRDEDEMPSGRIVEVGSEPWYRTSM